MKRALLPVEGFIFPFVEREQLYILTSRFNKDNQRFNGLYSHVCTFDWYRCMKVRVRKFSLDLN